MGTRPHARTIDEGGQHVRDDRIETRSIDGFPYYRVRSDGVVESCRARGGPGGSQFTAWHAMKLMADRLGYLHVELRRDGDPRRYRKKVHRLVLEAFVGPCPEGMEGCHADGDPRNNDLSNLRWDKHLANLIDAIGHGRRPLCVPGSDHLNAKLTEMDVIAMRKEHSRGGISYKSLGRRYGISDQQAKRVVCRQCWAHVSA